MVVDYYTCANCSENFPDCGDYFNCETCENLFCSTECVDTKYEDETNDDQYEDIEPKSTCAICRNELCTD